MKVCVTGHKGYIGTKLIMALPNAVGVDWRDTPPKDIRDQIDFSGCDAVIHLANISNDPSFDLKPGLAKSVNWDCFPNLVRAASDAGIKRFIFASSSSVYGVKQEKNVTEDLPLEPLTEYSKYKALCEEYLLHSCPKDMEFVIVRPATVCGYSPSMRLDLLVNIFTHHAWENGLIRVHGGSQYRPNIHIDDMVQAYLTFLEAPSEKVNGQIFNCGCQNLTLLETAETVRGVLGSDIKIEIEESRDPRSYHVNSDKIKNVLGFKCNKNVRQAIVEMAQAFATDLIPNPTDDKYYRVRQMKAMS